MANKHDHFIIFVSSHINENHQSSIRTNSDLLSDAKDDELHY